jgi:hypothetical protein
MTIASAPGGEPDFMRSDLEFDYTADDFHDLATQLGCEDQ